MFLEFAPAYFEYMAKAFYNNIPTVLCKILGVYTLGFHNKETGKKVRILTTNIFEISLISTRITNEVILIQLLT
jgi:1-phosphatidylinositol-3-phosphate 5-kinase